MGRINGIMSLELGPASDSSSGLGTASELEVGACTDVGRVRENNEDSFRLVPSLNLYVLSDGMGGMACGETASRLTVDTIVEHFRNPAANQPRVIEGQRIEGISETSSRLAAGISRANEIVYRTARESASGQKMGATVVAVCFTNGCMSLA